MLSQEREARARDAERLASEIDAKDTALAQAKMKQEQTDAELTETRARADEAEKTCEQTMADLETKADVRKHWPRVIARFRDPRTR